MKGLAQPGQAESTKSPSRQTLCGLENIGGPDHDPMSTTETRIAAAKPKLRWYQYSLRTLLLIMLLTSIVMSLWVIIVKRQREWQQIADALKSPARFEFAETPLTDVVAYLKDHYHIEIEIDRDALRAAGMEEDPDVTCNLSGISLQSFLRLELRQLDLTYIIRGNVLRITTPQQAAAMGAGPATVETSGANEKRIAQALQQPTQIEFVETPLKDVFDYLQDLRRIKILLDGKALERAGIAVDTPVTVTMNLKGVSLQSALRLLLGQQDLDYVIRDEVVLITTPAEAAAMDPGPPGFTMDHSAAAKRIAEALEQPTQLECVETPLADVVDYLKDLHHIEIQLDHKTMKQAGISDSTPVTFKRKGVSLQSALSAMLDGLDLQFEIRDEVLLIGPKKKDKH